MYIQDKLVNWLSNLNTGADKPAHGHFHRRILSKNEIDALYQSSWIAAQCIDVPVDDMTREWRVWNGGPRQSRALQAAERSLRVRQRVNQALKLARLYGGSAILIGDGNPDPTQPLEPASVGKGGLQFLHVLSRWEIWSGQLDRDPMSTWFGEPLYYQIASAGTSVGLPTLGGPVPLQPVSEKTPLGSVFVHPSRVVRFLGIAKPEISRMIDGWGFSVLDRLYDAIRNVESTAGNLASLTHEAKIDVIKVPGMTQNILSQDYRDKLTARFTVANQAKSIQNMLLLDGSEEWEQKTATFAGFPEVIKTYLEIVAGGADIPLTRFLGTSAKGFNATGQTDLRMYYDMLASKQEVELRPGLERMDELLIRHALGARPPELDYEFRPLWQMRENELAAIDLQRAQTAQIYATMGPMPPSVMAKAIQNRLIADATYPGLQELLEAAPNEPVGPLAQKAAEVGAEIDNPMARGTPAKDSADDGTVEP